MGGGIVLNVWYVECAILRSAYSHFEWSREISGFSNHENCCCRPMYTTHPFAMFYSMVLISLSVICLFSRFQTIAKSHTVLLFGLSQPCLPLKMLLVWSQCTLLLWCYNLKYKSLYHSIRVRKGRLYRLVFEFGIVLVFVQFVLLNELRVVSFVLVWCCCLVPDCNKRSRSNSSSLRSAWYYSGPISTPKSGVQIILSSIAR